MQSPHSLGAPAGLRLPSAQLSWGGRGVRGEKRKERPGGAAGRAVLASGSALARSLRAESYGMSIRDSWSLSQCHTELQRETGGHSGFLTHRTHPFPPATFNYQTMSLLRCTAAQ